MKHTYNIPTINIHALVAKIDKLNKRADKLGMAHIMLTEGDEYTHKVNGVGYVKFTPVTIIGEVPSIEGWVMVAALDHIDGNNIVHTLSDVNTVNVDYKIRAPRCDHCNTNRIKKYSYIIEEQATKKQMQVGRTCINDFFAKDVDNVVSYYKWFSDILDELRDEFSDYYGYSAADFVYNFKEALAIAFALVRTDGYKKSDELISTKEELMDCYLAVGGMNNVTVKYADKLNADNAITWLKEQTSDNDFIRNLQIFVDMVEIPTKFFGYVAGLVPFYLRSQEKKVDVKSEWVGNIGKRQEMTVTLQRITTNDTYYGRTYIHSFLDNENRQLVWFASTNPGFEVNNTYTVKATVKDHTKFRDIKQTKVNRVKAA